MYVVMCSVKNGIFGSHDGMPIVIGGKWATFKTLKQAEAEAACSQRNAAGFSGRARASYKFWAEVEPMFGAASLTQIQREFDKQRPAIARRTDLPVGCHARVQAGLKATAAALNIPLRDVRAWYKYVSQ